VTPEDFIIELFIHIGDDRCCESVAIRKDTWDIWKYRAYFLCSM